MLLAIIFGGVGSIYIYFLSCRPVLILEIIPEIITSNLFFHGNNKHFYRMPLSRKAWINNYTESTNRNDSTYFLTSDCKLS